MPKSPSSKKAEATQPPKRRVPTKFFIGVSAALALVVIAALAMLEPDKIFTPTLGGISSVNASNRFIKVSPDASLRMIVPIEIDRQHAAEVLQIPEGIEGAIGWDGDALVFSPTAPLQEGQEYTFVIPAGAQRSDGQRLIKPLSFTFDVAGPPAVSGQIPLPDSTNVPTDAAVTITFDRPMVSLGSVQSMTENDWPGTITPDVPGRWRWVGTSTIEFRPSEYLEAATVYTIDIPEGIKTPAGETVPSAQRWQFETVRPRVITMQPASPEEKVGADGPITLEFNLEMDLGRLKPFLKLTSAEGSDALSFSLNYKTETIDGETTTYRNIVLVEPSDLPLASRYSLQLAKGALAAEGDLGLENDVELPFATAEPLAVTAFETTLYDIRIDLNNPVTAADLSERLTFDPPLEDLNIGDWYGEEPMSSLYMYPGLRPGTQYTATLKAGLPDSFGQVLAEDYIKTFTTPDMAPEIYIHSKGQFGIFERGKPPVYYLNAMNVGSMEVALGRLDLADFLRKQDDVEPDYTVSEGLGAWELPVTKPKNNWQIFPFDVAETIKEELEPGVYQLLVQAPEYVDYNGQPVIQRQYFAVTDLAVTLKHSGSEVNAWVVNSQTGAPVAGAAVQVYGTDGNEKAGGTTDAQGFAKMPIDIDDFAIANPYDADFWAVVRTDDDVAYVSNRWSQGTEAYSFGYFEEFQGPQVPDFTALTYFFTERPLYRAGQEAHFKGIVRLRNSAGDLVPVSSPARSAQVTVHDAQDREVYNETLSLNTFGSFNGTLTLAEDASLGVYYVQTTVLPEEDIAGQYNTSTFQVLAYRKPEHRVDVLFDQAEYFDGDTVNATVAAAYYFGTAMTDATVNWRALLTDYTFDQYEGDGWYSFSDQEYCYEGCEEESGYTGEGEGDVNENGELRVSVPASLSGKDGSQILTLEADVVDDNNQLVSNRASVPVHKASVYVGLRTLEYGTPAGDSVEMDVVTVGTDGSVRPNQDVTLELYTRAWTSIRKKDVDGNFYWDNQFEDAYVGNQSVKTDNAGRAKAQVELPEGGEYRVLAKTKDDKGRENTAALGVYAYSDTYVNWPRTNSDRLEMIADKPAYKVGDTANILVKTPYQGEGVKAWVTVEREQVRRSSVINVNENAVPLQIEITEDMIPNAYVSVVIVKPRQGETFDDAGIDTGAPAFKMGLVKLSVEAERKAVTVDIKTDAERYLPRATVKTTITTKDWEGKPVPAEVSLGVVDLSLLALTGFNQPDLVAAFYTERGLGVRTSHLLSMLLERFKPGSKGGGFGDDSGARGEFKDTAYWNPTIITDANGTATVSFTLPDNLTTWQLLAIAHTTDSRFGSQDHEIIETKDVIVRAVRPRFGVRGDKIDLGAIVHNETTESKSFEVSLRGSGFSSEVEMTQSITLNAGERATVDFPVAVSGTDAIVLNLIAESGNGRDEIIETFPIHGFTSRQSVATAGVTEESVTETLYLPGPTQAENVQLTATLSPTVASYLPGGLAYLVTYPYGCAEQIMSSFLPSVALQNLQNLGSFDLADEDEIEARVSVGLQKLYQLQRSDGGFGYWSESRESNAAISAYILYGLQQAKDAGFTVDAGVIERARGYLINMLAIEKPNWPEPDTLRAQILFTLAESGGADAGRLRTLFERRQNLPLYAQAFYLMALQTNNSTRDLAATLESELISRLHVEERTAQFDEPETDASRWYLNTEARTNALGLMALTRSDDPPEALPRLVRYLLSVRENNHWDTTQSTSYALLALAEYLDMTGELDADFVATLALGDKDVAETSFDASNVLTHEAIDVPLADIETNSDQPLQISKNGDGLLYYDLVLSYDWAADMLPAEEAGFSLLRTITPVQSDTPLEPGEALKAGENYRVALTVTVPEDRYAVALESPLPAGAEAIDPNLQTNQQLAEDVQTDNTTRNKYGWWWWEPFTHVEYRDDQVFLFAEHLTPGVYRYEYIMRATVPGTFFERPAHVWEMYFPEHFGQTSGQKLTIQSSD